MQSVRMIALCGYSDKIVGTCKHSQARTFTRVSYRYGFRNSITRNQRRLAVAKVLGVDSVSIKPPTESATGNIVKDSAVVDGLAASPSAGVGVHHSGGFGSSLVIPVWQLVSGVAVASLASFAAGMMIGVLPVFRAMRSAADEVRDVSMVVKEQVPDTLSAVRLSGVDISELSSEVTELTRNVSESIRITNNAVRVVRAGIDFSRVVVDSQIGRIQPLSRAATKAGAHVRVAAGSYLARKLRERLRQDRRRTSVITTQALPLSSDKKASASDLGDQDNAGPVDSTSVFSTRKTET